MCVFAYDGHRIRHEKTSLKTIGLPELSSNGIRGAHSRLAVSKLKDELLFYIKTCKLS